MVKPRRGRGGPFRRGRDEGQEPQNPFESEDFSLSPIGFFAVEVVCHSLPATGSRLGAAYLLPDLPKAVGEDSFAKVFLGWRSAAIRAVIQVDKPFDEASFPEVQSGDSVELFFDTRNVKTSGYNTRFCHHFFFLPKPMDGRVAGELTRFRTEDKHEWCDPADLKVTSTLSKQGYTLDIIIPASCLHGYDPAQFDRIGFTYRINRCGGPPQHFSVSSEDYQIEEQPSLWGSLRLAE